MRSEALLAEPVAMDGGQSHLRLVEAGETTSTGLILNDVDKALDGLDYREIHAGYVAYQRSQLRRMACRRQVARPQTS